MIARGKDLKEPYPVHTLRRVERPTTLIKDSEVRRVDERESGFNRAARGDFGSRLQAEVKRFVNKHPSSASLLKMTYHLRKFSEGLPAPQKAPLPDDPDLLARHVKAYAYFLRADLVGICRLPPYAVYSHTNPDGRTVDLDHKYAIAILVDQNWETARATNGHDWISNSMSFMSYSASGFIASILADYIRRLGFPARAHFATQYQVVVPPILLWAGLGEMSRIGDCVLNPFLGVRFKAAVVTTDLPLAPDRPIDFGLQDFCSRCKKCARECPSRAISFDEKVLHNGYEHWQTDIERCTAMRVGNKRGSGCGTCLKVCPWNKPFTPFHRVVNWFVRRSSLARRAAIWGDDLMGFGTPLYDDQWWLDLEDLDGILKAPSVSDKEGEDLERENHL